MCCFQQLTKFIQQIINPFKSSPMEVKILIVIAKISQIIWLKTITIILKKNSNNCF